MSRKEAGRLNEKEEEMYYKLDRLEYLTIAKGNLHEAQSCLDVAESILCQGLSDEDYKDLTLRFEQVGKEIWELEKLAEGRLARLKLDLIRQEGKE